MVRGKTDYLLRSVVGRYVLDSCDSIHRPGSICTEIFCSPRTQPSIIRSSCLFFTQYYHESNRVTAAAEPTTAPWRNDELAAFASCAIATNPASIDYSNRKSVKQHCRGTAYKTILISHKRLNPTIMTAAPGTIDPPSFACPLSADRHPLRLSQTQLTFITPYPSRSNT